MANRLRWAAVVAIVVGWLYIRSEVDSLAMRVALVAIAFGTTSALVLWRPPAHGIFRERQISPRARKVFVPAEAHPRDPFVFRRRYRVLRSFDGVSDPQLKEGQIVCYVGRAYLPCDCLISFSFLSADGKTLFWALRDDEPLETWRDVFEEVA